MAQWSIEGQLEAKDASSTATLAEYRVELLFQRKVQPSAGDGAGEPATSGRTAFEDRAAAHTDDAGRFVLTLPEESELVGTSARLTVAAPAGKTVGGGEVTFAELHEPLKVRVDVPGQVTVTPADPVAAAPAIHVSGQVIDPTGKALAPGVQLTLVARTDGGDAPWQPVLVAKVDPSGKFFGDVPNREYADAAAIVPGTDERIPVPLEGGRIAARMLLAAEFSGEDAAPDGARSVVPPRSPTQSDIASAPETYSTDLGTGRCIDFNTPNRAIEEFDFYTVVRTTEPVVRPVTLPGTEPAAAPPVSAGNGSGPLTAVRYDVLLQTRELADPGDIRISFVDDGGARMMLTEHAVAAGGERPVPVRAAGLLGDPAGDDDLASARVNRESWAVTEGDTEAIGLDLRSIRGVEVEPVDAEFEQPWALVGIRITATTQAEERMPILIEGAEAYSGSRGSSASARRTAAPSRGRARRESASRAWRSYGGWRRRAAEGCRRSRSRSTAAAGSRSATRCSSRRSPARG